VIDLITGKVGSGKSLLATNRTLGIVGRGGCVVSNIQFSEEGVDRYLFNHYGRRRLGKDQIRFHDFEVEPDFRWSVPRGIKGFPTHVFVDEAQLFYNSVADRELKGTLFALIKYLTQTRKLPADVSFITQAPETIWAQFKYQALFEYRCRDMRVLSVPVFGPIFSGLRYSLVDIKSNQVLSSHKTPLKKDLFACYDTMQGYDADMRELLEKTEQWKPLSKNHTQYPDALTCHCCNRHRSSCVCRVSGEGLFRRRRRAETAG
jgi:hypothetical protein